jgi:DNA-binding CsgD family transcriptional regulator
MVNGARESSTEKIMQPTPKISLTARETQILNLVCAGQTSKMIAKTLMISPRTVEMHRANLMRKSRARNFAQLSFQAPELMAMAA